eukprot:g68.t1
MYTVRGHRNVITHFAIDPHNRVIASASTDGVLGSTKDLDVRISSLRSGETQNVLRGHTDTINLVSFDPNSGCLVTVSDDSTARVWAPSTLVHAEDVVGETDEAGRASAREEVVVIQHAELSVWGGNITEDRAVDNSLSFCPSGSTFLTCQRSTVRLFRIQMLTAAEAAAEMASNPVLPAITFEAQAQKATSVGSRYVSQRYRVVVTLVALLRDMHKVSLARFSHLGDRILTVAKNQTIRLWHSVPSKPASFTSSSSTSASLPHAPENIFTFDGATQTELKHFPKRKRFAQRPQTRVKVTSRRGRPGKSSASSSSAEELDPQPLEINEAVWSLADDKIVSTHSIRGGPECKDLGKPSHDPDTCQKCKIHNLFESCVCVWNPVTGTLDHMLELHTKPVLNVQPHPLDARIVASFGMDGQISVWNIYNGEVLKTIMHTCTPAACSNQRPDFSQYDANAPVQIGDGCWNASGTLLIVGDWNGRIAFLGADSGVAFTQVPEEQYFNQDYHDLTWDQEGFVQDSEHMLAPHEIPPHINLLVSFDATVQPTQPPPYGPLLEDLAEEQEVEELKDLDGMQLAEIDEDARESIKFYYDWLTREAKPDPTSAYIYAPQIGDDVVYLPQGHEEQLNKFPNYFPCPDHIDKPEIRNLAVYSSIVEDQVHSGLSSQRVPVPMSLTKVCRRLRNNFYRRSEAVSFDLDLIVNGVKEVWGTGGSPFKEAKIIIDPLYKKIEEICQGSSQAEGVDISVEPMVSAEPSSSNTRNSETTSSSSAIDADGASSHGSVAAAREDQSSSSHGDASIPNENFKKRGRTNDNADTFADGVASRSKRTKRSSRKADSSEEEWQEEASGDDKSNEGSDSDFHPEESDHDSDDDSEESDSSSRRGRRSAPRSKRRRRN